MKHLKTFEFFETETGQSIDYEEGDIVICSDDKSLGGKIIALNVGNEYRVLRIYSNLEDKFLNIKYKRVDVEDLETGKISRGWESTRFKTEVEFDGDKYNL